MPAGRPTEYRLEYVERAKEMCINGATDADLADEFEVSVTTIRNWCAKFPEFLAALKPAKEIADDRVERSLYSRATGYTFNSVKIFCNKEGEITQVPFLEHVPPDTTAAIFWLKNRRQKDWRDKSEVDHNITTVMVPAPAKDASARPATTPAFDEE